MRDGDVSRYLGKGVQSAVDNVTERIAEALVGLPVDEQRVIDEVMIEMDGTQNKANLGANSMLGASMACLHAGAAVHELPLWKYIGGVAGGLMPVPMLNILNGGAHAASNVDVQEFMVMPHGFDTFEEGLRAGVETYHALKKELKADGLLGGVGDEGGFAPNLPANEEGLKYMVRAIEGAGYSTEQMGIALDVAATEFHHDDGYHMDGQVLSSEALADVYSGWLDEYPILSIEDGFGEDDWKGWSLFTKREGHRVQTVGDDLFVTQSERLAQGIEIGAANAMLVKLNQVGTVTETLEAMDLASSHGFNNVISHRSGETEDVTIADLAVGTLRSCCKVQSIIENCRRCERVSLAFQLRKLTVLYRGQFFIMAHEQSNCYTHTSQPTVDRTSTECSGRRDRRYSHKCSSDRRSQHAGRCGHSSRPPRNASR
jgi:enolase